MGLKCLELAGKHFMVRISAYQNHVVEIAVERKLVCVERKPCVYAFLDDSSSRCFSEVLVMEDHIIFDKHVFEFSFALQEVFACSLFNAITPSVVM